MPRSLNLGWSTAPILVSKNMEKRGDFWCPMLCIEVCRTIHMNSDSLHGPWNVEKRVLCPCLLCDISLRVCVFVGHNKGNIFSFACCSWLCVCCTHKVCAVALPELWVQWLINYDDCDHMFKNFHLVRASTWNFSIIIDSHLVMIKTLAFDDQSHLFPIMYVLD